MLYVEDETVWKEDVKTDTYVKRLHNKSFPFFNDWTEVFGKDRANGEQADDIGGVVNTNLNDDDDGGTNLPTEMQSDGEEIMSPAPNAPNLSEPGSSAAKDKSGGKKKRKLNVDTTGDAMVNLMRKFCEQTSGMLTEIASKIGYEFMMSSKQEKLFETVSKLVVLCPDDVLVVVRRLANNINDLDLFFTLPQEEQSRLVPTMVTGRY